MKKLINLRIPLVAAVGLILGIYSCYGALFGRWYIAVIALVLLVAGIVTALALKNSAYKAFVILLICAAAGFGRTQLELTALNSRVCDSQTVTVVGSVSDIGRNGDDINVYYLQNCRDESSGARIYGRIKITYNGDEFDVGDVLTVSGVISSVYPVKSSVNTFYLRNNVAYEINNVAVLKYAHGTATLGERIRGYIYRTAKEYMPRTNGLLYTLLTGDRNAMSNTDKQIFTDAGVIHLFAVSGLHVGFIVSVICFALRKLHLHPALECAIVAVPLFAYAYVCNFSPSVMRAFIMVLCGYAARLLFGRADFLTSLSVAATVLLLVQPFYIFDAGFQLSFLSVFGIAAFYAPVSRSLARAKCNRAVRRIVEALLLSLCCSVATAFTVAANFGVVPTLSALVNVIAVPVISVAFVLGMFGLIPWIFRYLLTASDYLLYALVKIATAVSSLNFATVTFTVFAAATLFVVIAGFVTGGYVNIRKRAKFVVCGICAVAVFLCVLLSALPKRAENKVYVAMSYGNTAIAAISQSGSAALIADFDSAYVLQNAVDYCERFNISDCTLYIPDYNSADARLIAQILERLPIVKVYKLNVLGNDKLDEILANAGIPVVYQMENTVMGGDVKVRSMYDGDFIAVCVSVGDIDVCSVVNDKNAQSSLLNVKPDCDFYVLNAENSTYSEAGLVTLSYYQGNTPLNYGANKYGNFTITQKGGKIILSFT